MKYLFLPVWWGILLILAFFGTARSVIWYLIVLLWEFKRPHEAMQFAWRWGYRGFDPLGANDEYYRTQYHFLWSQRFW